MLLVVNTMINHYHCYHALCLCALSLVPSWLPLSMINPINDNGYPTILDNNCCWSFLTAPSSPHPQPPRNRSSTRLIFPHLREVGLIAQPQLLQRRQRRMLPGQREQSFNIVSPAKTCNKIGPSMMVSMVYIIYLGLSGYVWVWDGSSPIITEMDGWTSQQLD